MGTTVRACDIVKFLNVIASQKIYDPLTFSLATNRHTPGTFCYTSVVGIKPGLQISALGANYFEFVFHGRTLNLTEFCL
jgi:hypothetical protein